MMRYIIDSHTFLWFGTNDTLLPKSVAALIASPDNDISISIASFWELAIKFSLGKLPLKSNILGLERQAYELNIEIAPLTIAAIHQMTLLPEHHKDPFDRIIAASALSLGDPLLSADSIFDAYGVARIWS